MKKVVLESVEEIRNFCDRVNKLSYYSLENLLENGAIFEVDESGPGYCVSLEYQGYGEEECIKYIIYSDEEPTKESFVRTFNLKKYKRTLNEDYTYTEVDGIFNQVNFYRVTTKLAECCFRLSTYKGMAASVLVSFVPKNKTESVENLVECMKDYSANAFLAEVLLICDNVFDAHLSIEHEVFLEKRYQTLPFYL